MIKHLKILQILLLAFTLVQTSFHKEIYGSTIKTQTNKDSLIVKSGKLEVSFIIKGKKKGKKTEQIKSYIRSLKYGQKEFINQNNPIYIRSFGSPLRDGKPVITRKAVKKLGHSYTVKVKEKKDYVEVIYSEEPRKAWPLSTQIGWIVKKGEPGIYYYVTLHHSKEMEDVKISQHRMSIRLTPDIFQKAYIEKDRIYDIIPDKMFENSKQIMDATYLLANGRAVTKYEWSTRKEDQRFYGFSGRDTGIWHHFPSMEYINAGPNKQSNTEHHTYPGLIILNVMTSAHYGSTTPVFTGEFSKMYGPFFLHLTDKKDFKKNLAVAEAKQKKLEKEWPFKWFKHPYYKDERGTVTGRVIVNHRTADNALILLTTEKASNMTGTMDHGQKYMYWARTKKDGSFRIDKIVPDDYYLHCTYTNSFEDYKMGPIKIRANKNLNLKTLKFQDKRKGKLIWQIGIPDRDSTEFAGAGNNRFRPFLGRLRLKDRYNGDNPIFTVGKSDYKEDFYFIQPLQLVTLQDYINLVLDIPGADHSAFTNVPSRKIVFNMDKVQKGKYTFTLGLASQCGPDIIIRINHKIIGEYHSNFRGNAEYRSGSYGRPFVLYFEFDSEILKQGKNLLQIDHKEGWKLLKTPKNEKRVVNKYFMYGKKPRIWNSIIYDALKLEYDVRSVKKK